LPIGPVYGLAQALENPFVQATHMINTVAHPLRAELKCWPIRSRSMAAALNSRPDRGRADNQALLGRLPRPMSGIRQ